MAAAKKPRRGRRDDLKAIRGFLEGLRHVGCAKETNEKAACTCGLDAARTSGVALHLTPRERKVIGTLATGLSNKAIAETLGISPGTFKVYLSHLYQKLQLSRLPVNARVFIAVHAKQILAGVSTQKLLKDLKC